MYSELRLISATYFRFLSLKDRKLHANKHLVWLTTVFLQWLVPRIGSQNICEIAVGKQNLDRLLECGMSVCVCVSVCMNACVHVCFCMLCAPFLKKLIPSSAAHIDLPPT